MNAKERRVSKRWQCHLPAEIKFKNGRIAEVTIRSIGKNGALIEATTLDGIGKASDRFTLTIAPKVWLVNGKDVEVDGTLVRAGQSASWGIAFHSVSPEVEELISLFQQAQP